MSNEGPSYPLLLATAVLMCSRSFYPIFPPPLDLAHEVNLDVSHSERLKLTEDAAPSVLILPSKLKQFHKVGRFYASAPE